MSSPLDFFQYKKDFLQSEGVDLERLAGEFGTPLYVYSSQAFLKPLELLKTHLKPLNPLICFAVKSNSNLSILKLMGENGAGVDAVSGGELFRAEKASVPGDRIVFSGVGKTVEEIRYGLDFQKKGIFSFNVESLPELELINQVALSKKKKAPVALRFNPDVDPKTHPYISTGLKKNKFGLTRAEILEAVRSFEQFKGVHFRGLSIHIGSQLLSLSPLEDAFTKVNLLVDEMEDLLHRPLEMIDLGGGLGINYHQESPPSIPSYCKMVRKHFAKRSRNFPPLKILIEPGRALAGNSGVLISQILFRKKRSGKDFIILDAAMNDLMRPALYQSYHEIVPLHQRLAQGPQRKATVAGPVCESADCFASDRPFPAALQAGDFVAILSAGAYGFSMSSTYNSRPRAAEVLIEKGSYRLIRRRETWADLIRGE